MPVEKVTPRERFDLVTELSEKYTHLDKETHFRLVKAGYGNWFGKEHFRGWYD